MGVTPRLGKNALACNFPPFRNVSPDETTLPDRYHGLPKPLLLLGLEEFLAGRPYLTPGGSEVVHERHFGNLMMLIRTPRGGSDEYTVQIGDYGPLDEFVPRDCFTFSELPIVGRLLSAVYP
jgi:hypothetical protein